MYLASFFTLNFLAAFSLFVVLEAEAMKELLFKSKYILCTSSLYFTVFLVPFSSLANDVKTNSSWQNTQEKPTEIAVINQLSKPKSETIAQALEINPLDAEAYYNRGFAYADLQQYSRAIANYDRAIEINPEDTDAYYNRGTAYFILGNIQQARSNWEQAAILFQQHNNPQGYQKVQRNLKKLSQNRSTTVFRFRQIIIVLLYCGVFTSCFVCLARFYAIQLNEIYK